ncbi:MAG TPA: YfhL family 4Fe-4S dicluster ferredoxin [Candidatus Binatus sp.]
MATTITSECINCGACEPECPNTAIYAGGAPWELDGATSPAIAQEIYYIVPSKCTECVGFYDHEACAAVCPVDCCIPDPANVESEGVLLARARKLHPDETIPDDPPSRFRKPAVAASAQAPAPAAAVEAVAPVAPKPAPAPAEAAKPAAAPTAAPKPAVAAAKPVVAPAAAAPAAATSADRAEFDPLAWEVPVICKDCNGPWKIPYRLFAQGVVFHCPSCLGSFVPKTAMYRAVRETFEGFYNRRRAQREAFERKPARDAAAFEAKQAAEMKEFKQKLEALAHSMKPAGKTVRPKGIAAMFT